jgi:CHAD domain-containing protein
VGLEVMGGTAFEAAPTRSAARALRDVERALGPTRDDDVLVEHLDRWLEGAEARRSAQAAPLRERVRKQRTKHARALARALERKPARAAMRQLRRLLEHPEEAATRPPANAARTAPNLVRHFVRRVAWQAYEEVLAYEVRGTEDIDVAHKFRSACRRLRFTLELFEGATHGIESIVEPLHALQSRLGDLHDHAVAVARVKKWLAHSRLPRTPAIVDYVEQRARARGALLAEFEALRASVSALPFREALFQALEGPSARPGQGRLRLVPAA